ncbi:VOC family protein [Polluticaenibacter yanchengensis]|uniref:VOC family protein n=1 Tax=Polluticaenibacter yanchengensis TaxID=3014562 RepID=A0ABT4UKA3_9BACT|nr:VOC family protein [Chitinophagaceae bacterium LY-5]
MKTRFIWANLVSGDIPKTIAFYAALGFKQNGSSDNLTAASFIFGQSHFIINFFTEQRLSKQVNGGLSIPKNSNEIIFSLSADSIEEVEKWHEKIKSINGTIFSEPQKIEQGYTFGFTDPDNHRFNVLYWPGM